MKPWLPAMRRHMAKTRSRTWLNPLHYPPGEWPKQRFNRIIWKYESDAGTLELHRAAHWYAKQGRWRARALGR